MDISVIYERKICFFCNIKTLTIIKEEGEEREDNYIDTQKGEKFQNKIRGLALCVFVMFKGVSLLI